jgi:hypothetical protein
MLIPDLMSFHDFSFTRTAESANVAAIRGSSMAESHT